MQSKHFQNAENEALKTQDAKETAKDLLMKVSMLPFSKKRSVISWAHKTFEMFKSRKMSVSKTGREVFEALSNNDNELEGYQRIISTVNIFFDIDRL